jgi:shugoshin
MVRKSTEFVTSLRKYQKSRNIPAGFLEHNNDESSSSSPSSQSPSTDLVNSRYIAQNQALARTNAVMATKISDLETRISQLIQENTELRLVLTWGTSDRTRLTEKLTAIEAGLVTDFNRTLTTLKEIRRDLHLPQSNYGPFSLPFTSSTPTEESSFFLPTALFPTSKHSKSSSPEPDRLHSHPRGSRNKVESHSMPDPVLVKEPKKPEIASNVSVILEQDEETLMSLNDVIPEVKQTKKSSKKIASTSGVVRGKNKHHKSTTNATKPKTQAAPEQSQNRSPVKIEVFKDTPPPPPSPPPLESGPQRPRRNTKKVDYKPVPLGAKLRRESTSLVDAADENAFNFVLSETKKSTKKRRLSQSPALSNITNTKREKPSSKDLKIFDFEDENEIEPRSRRFTMNV